MLDPKLEIELHFRRSQRVHYTGEKQKQNSLFLSIKLLSHNMLIFQAKSRIFGRHFAFVVQNTEHTEQKRAQSIQENIQSDCDFM